MRSRDTAFNGFTSGPSTFNVALFAFFGGVSSSPKAASSIGDVFLRLDGMAVRLSMAARAVDGSDKQTNGRVSYIAPAVGFPTSETVSPTPKRHSKTRKHASLGFHDPQAEPADVLSH